MKRGLDWQIGWKCAVILGILMGVFLLPSSNAASYWLDENETSLTTGIVGYWKFSEGAGSTTNDSSGYNNHGTLTSFDYNATSGWTDGKYGKALRFDGVNDYVDVGDSTSFDTTEAITITAWVNRIQSGNRDGILIKRLGGTGPEPIDFEIDSNNKLVFNFQNSTSDWQNSSGWYGNTVISAGVWHHIAVTYNRQTVTIYLDGVADGTYAETDAIGTSNRNIYIGTAYSADPAYVFNGTIDEVRIYNRALSADEISQLYQAGRIRLANDFISVRADPYIQLNLTNSTNHGIMKLVSEEIKLNNTPITSIYYANPLNNSYKVYFYDWENSRWLIWMNRSGGNNATHGTPDFTKPIYKQAFKWMYFFNRTSYPTLNITYVLTASDPFVRQIIDVNTTSTANLEIPLTVNQTEKRMCLSANYTDGKLSSWNERNCYEYGNPYTAYDAVWRMKSTVDFNDTGLVGYWKLDEGSGQAVKDLSGYNNNGTLGASAASSTDDPTWFTNDSCKFGNCLRFDGSNDYVNTGNNAVLRPNTLTLEGWIKPNAWANAPEIAGVRTSGDDGGYHLFINAAGKLNWLVGESLGVWKLILIADNAFVAGTWYHIVGLYESGKGEIWINGVKQTQTSTATGNIYYSGTPSFNVGWASSASRYFNGTIDEVRIYNRALSVDEISQHYQTQTIFYNSTYNIQPNEWNLSSQVNKTTDKLNFTFYLDNDYFNSSINKTLQLTLPDIVNTSNIALYYNASDNTWRNFTELRDIGYGFWNYTVFDSDYGIKKRLNISYSLAGGDGYDYGLRDSTAGGSYWLDNNGNSLTSGLVGYWKFGEGNGSTANDSSGYSNTGTLTDMNTTGNATSGWNSTDCKFGSCLRFDGVNDYVNLGSSSTLLPTNTLTLEAWVKPGVLGASADVVSKGINSPWYGYLLARKASKWKGVITVGGVAYEAISNADYTQNKWVHLATTYDNAILKLYVDGVLQDTTASVTGDITYTGTRNPVIGTWAPADTTEVFNGTIDEVRIYNRALSAEEISQQYQAGRIRLANDFISVRADPYIQLNLTNSTNGGLMKLVSEEIKIDNISISTIYPAATINNSYKVYYYDWGNNSWKVWMKSASNSTHGMPDWLDTRYKQEFKWMYSFNRSGYPSVNISYLMTAHDPFVRIFVDTVNSTADNHNLTLPINLQQNKSMLDAGLVGYWPMEEGSGSSAYDYSNYKNTGTLTNMNTTGNATSGWNSTDCKFGSCLRFDGLNDYVDAGDAVSLNITGSITLEAWMKPGTLGTFAQVVGKAGPSPWYVYGLRKFSDDKLGSAIQVGTSSYNTKSNNVYVQNQWVHLASTYDGSTIKVYVDGVLQTATTSVSGSINSSTTDAVTIGNWKRGGTLDDFFNGTIDEVRIYNRALSADEIWQRYQLGQSRLKPGNYYYRNSTSDNILFTTQNFRPSYRGNLSSPTASEFNITEDSTLDKITYDYKFNSTFNKNFMFSLGTTGYQNTNLNMTNFAVNRTLGYSNETLESVANSTLTWYDFNTTNAWNKTDYNPYVQHNVSVIYNYDGGAVGIWKFEEVDSKNYTSDSSGFGNNGQLINYSCNPASCNLTDGKYGKGLKFDGVNDYINGGDVNAFEFANNVAFTFEAWINTSATARAFLISKADATFEVPRGATGIIGIWTDTSLLEGVGSINNGNWHHVAITRDTSNIGSIYIDGKLDKVGSLPGAYGKTFPSDSFIIGQGSHTLGYYYNGSADEVRIYNRALSPWEIKEHYSKEVSKYVDDYNTGIYRYFGLENTSTNFSSPIDHSTVLALRFDEVSGSTIANDSSKYGNNGTLTNMNTTGNATSGWNSTDCKYGSCLRFDGVNDYVDAGSGTSLKPTAAITVEAWINPKAYPVSNSIGKDIVSQYDSGADKGWYFTLYRGGSGALVIFWVLSIGNINYDSPPSLNTWTYVVGTYDSVTGSMKIYQDGKLVKSGSVAAGTLINYGSSSLKMGDNILGEYFNGTLDEVRVYNRALSADEIRDNYLKGMPKRVIDGKEHYVRNQNDFAFVKDPVAYNLTDIDSSTLQDYDTKLLRLEVNYTDDSLGKTTYQFSNTTDNKYGLQSMLKPWIVLMNYQTSDQPLFVTTSRKILSSIPLKVTADENEAITKLTFNQSFSSNTNLTLAFGYLGTVNTRSDTG